MVIFFLIFAYICQWYITSIRYKSYYKNYSCTCLCIKTQFPSNNETFCITFKYFADEMCQRNNRFLLLLLTIICYCCWVEYNDMWTVYFMCNDSVLQYLSSIFSPLEKSDIQLKSTFVKTYTLPLRYYVDLNNFLCICTVNFTHFGVELARFHIKTRNGFRKSQSNRQSTCLRVL